MLLADLAARHQTITYGELARQLGLRMAVLTAQLEALMDQDAARGEPLRAVLCAGRLLQNMPATGFFLKAAELGRLSADASPTEQADYVARERMALFQAASTSVHPRTTPL